MKKKILVAILLGCMTLGLVGCGGTSDSEEPLNNDVVVQDEIKNNGNEQKQESVSNKNAETRLDYVVYINDTKVSFPCSYEDILNASNGYMHDLSVNPNTSGWTELYDKSLDYKIGNICFENISSEAQSFSSCQAIGIIQDYEQDINETGVVVTFPNGLKIGDEISKEELIELYGEPDLYTDTEGFEFLWGYENPEAGNGGFQAYIKDGRLVKAALFLR